MPTAWPMPDAASDIASSMRRICRSRPTKRLSVRVRRFQTGGVEPGPTILSGRTFPSSAAPAGSTSIPSGTCDSSDASTRISPGRRTPRGPSRSRAGPHPQRSRTSAPARPEAARRRPRYPRSPCPHPGRHGRGARLGARGGGGPRASAEHRRRKRRGPHRLPPSRPPTAGPPRRAGRVKPARCRRWRPRSPVGARVRRRAGARGAAPTRSCCRSGCRAGRERYNRGSESGPGPRTRAAAPPRGGRRTRRGARRGPWCGDSTRRAHRARPVSHRAVSTYPAPCRGPAVARSKALGMPVVNRDRRMRPIRRPRQGSVR